MPQPNFPDSPTVNQEYTYSGSTWVWTGQYWRVQQAPSTNNNFIPAANVTYDLGSANQRWRDLYLSGNTMYLGAASLSSSGSGLNLPAGSTVGGTAVASTTDVVNTIATAVIKIGNIQVTGNTFVPLDDTAVDTAGGFVRINGAGFVAGCSVLIGSQSASAVSFLSATALGVTVPALSAGTYTVYVTNPDGSVAIRVNGLNINGVPSWTTAAGLTDQFIDSAISIQLTANSNSTVSYTLQGGSSLPPGITLSNVGLLSGTVTGLVADTTYTFTVVATDLENQDTPRTFTVTIITVQQISRSLRFNSADSTYLNRTPTVAGNRRTYTLSLWVKRSGLGTEQHFLSVTAATNVNGWLTTRFTPADKLYIDTWGINLSTDAVFRDTSAWYHVVFAVDTTQTTDTNRWKIYVNGTQQTVTGSYPTLNLETAINSTNVHNISRYPYESNNFINGYMAEINFVDGQALTPASFGRTDLATGTWVPMRYTGTYGTNGFYLNFANNASTSSLGVDSSGNNNTWTLNNFSVTAGTGNDSLIDSPSSYGSDTGLGGEIRGGYATLNPLVASQTAATLSNGNMDVVTPTTGTGKTNYGEVTATIGVSSGKWYWEVLTVAFSGTKSHVIGVDSDANASGTNGLIEAGNRYSYASFNGNKYSGATGSSYGATYDIGDIVGVALDLDTGSITFYKNGVSQGVAFTGLTGTYFPAMSDTGGGNATLSFNFGQRPFAYAAPATYKALNTANLPVPTIGLGAQNQARNYFEVITYTGNGGAKSITVGFQPDFIWIKNRNVSNNYHNLIDSLRGANRIYSNGDANSLTNAEESAPFFAGFTSTGFDLNGNNGNVNGANESYVAWCWNAGGVSVINSAGTNGATIASTYRANLQSGFSIVLYTGNGVVGATVRHGLSSVPGLVLIKNRSTTANWAVKMPTVMTGAQRLQLNTTNGYLSESAGAGSLFNAVNPNSSVITLGDFSMTNSNGNNYVAYCWAEVPGFSAFGSYTGNGSADGPFVYLGFKPRWLLIRRSDTTENWNITDTARDPFNIVSLELYPNLTNVEAGSAASYRDFLSNGFKIRGTGGGFNTTGGTYIYAAFAETPLKYTRAR